jgi:hypothetical protein
MFPAGMSTEELQLPQYVKSVGVLCHRLLPSLFAVSLRAILEKGATDTLNRVQSDHYLPEIRFWPMVPTGTGYSSSSARPDSIAHRAVAGYLQQVRSGIEDCFAPFLCGHFMSGPRGGPRLPAVEVYELKGTGTGAESFGTWKASAFSWWRSMALELYPSKLFRDRHAVLTLNGSLHTGGDAPYKLVILRDEMPVDARFVTAEDFLEAAIPLFATRAFVDSIAVDVGKARRRVYRALSRRRMLHGLLSDIGLSRRLSREIMSLERVNVELEHGEGSVRDSRLTDLVSDAFEDGAQRNLYDALIRALTFQVKTVRRHVKVMATSFSEHLLVRDMALMYGLQWVILLLTILSIIVAAVGTASNWDQVERFWHKVERREAPQPAPTETGNPAQPSR